MGCCSRCVALCAAVSATWFPISVLAQPWLKIDQGVAAGPGVSIPQAGSPYRLDAEYILPSPGTYVKELELRTPVGSPVIGENTAYTRVAVTATPNLFSATFFSSGRDVLPGAGSGIGVGGTTVLWMNVTVQEVTPFRASTSSIGFSGLPGVPFADAYGFFANVSIVDPALGIAIGDISLTGQTTTGFLLPGFIYNFTYNVFGGAQYANVGYLGVERTYTFELVPSPGTAGLLAVAAVFASRRRR